MKILHIIPSFLPASRYGGPIYAAFGLARELVRIGHEVTVMTTNIDGPGVLDVPLEQPVNMEGVTVWYFPVERPRSWCFSRPMGNALQRMVNTFDLVEIHSIFLWPTTIAAFWCRRYRVPYIIRPAGSLDPTCLAKRYERWWVSVFSKAKKRIYLATLGRTELKHAAAIHFTSQVEMEQTHALKLSTPGFVAALGVDIQEYDKSGPKFGLRESYPQFKEKKIIVFLSRIDRKKGFDLLIPALCDLASRSNAFAFVVAGGGQREYVQVVKDLVAKNHLADITAFLGIVKGPAKWSLLRDADIFVLPSYQENFGIAVVEAMAVGPPVVISSRVNIHKEITAAHAGLVTSLDPFEISLALDELLGNDELRRHMGQNAARLVREQFTWETSVNRILENYTRVIAHASSGSVQLVS